MLADATDRPVSAAVIPSDRIATVARSGDRGRAETVVAGEETPSFGDVQGEIAQGTVQFDPAAAAIGLKACDTLVSRLLAVKQSTSDVASLPPFAGPQADFPSGTELADEYSTLAGELATILTTHIALLGNMADTFKAAARVFGDAESDSAQAFEGLTISGAIGDSYRTRPSLDVPASGQNINPLVIDPTAAALLGMSPGTVIGNYTKPDDGRAVDPENPYAKKWKPLYDLGVSINHASVTAVATFWQWMATEIQTGVDEFTRTALGEGGQGTEYSIQSGWVGQSAEMARRAVRARTDDGTALATTVTAVGARLATIANWLEKTKSAMPPLPDDPALPSNPQAYMLDGKATALAPLSTYQQACEIHYCTGLIGYNTTLVTLATPSAQPTTTPVIRDTPQPSGTTPTETPSPTTQPETPATTETPKTTQQPQNTQQQTSEQQALTAAQQIAQTLIQQGTQVAQQGIAAAQQIAQQVVQTVQQGIETATQQTTEQVTNEAPVTTPPTTTLDAKPRAGIPTGTGGTPTSPTSTTPELRTTAVSPQSFPRATAPEGDSPTTSTRAGLATGSTSTAPGSMGPMSPGAGAAAAGQNQAKQHERAKYLDSTEHILEAYGTAPKVVRPVADS
ncbi:hypothetical protein HLB23_24420 [Nocardia uniformis]|uniref:Uncharacterized protein n=1 Tax=Nocardia uniformis TaxID=53432 RepID=A0A849C5L1_9NOCA|nr:hypothetical protein [Nocardia uniformis]NNH72966.1 hypothetical protein [Nocardia uniformis]